METINIATAICEHLENISSNTKSLYDCLGLLKSQDVYKSLIQKSENILRSVDGQMENTKKIYNEFSSSIKTICDKYMNEVKKMKEMSQNDIRTLKNDFEEIKNELNMKKEELKKLSLQNEEKTTFIYRNQVKSKVNMELVMKYPSSYFYNEYNSDRRTAEGDIFIDIDGTNDELIVKYMKNDTSLVENVKEMNANQKNNLIKELDFLELPIKHEICCHLYEDKDNATMEAWRKREVLVNSSRSVEFNELLKRHQLFEPLFAQHHLEDIRYHKTLNIYYINIELYYFDIILLYLREEKFSKDLIQRYGNIKTIKEELQQEMEKIGIQLTEEQINLIETYSDERSLRGSNIIDLGTDQKLAKWIGKDHQWKLIYRASEHDFSSKSFHKCSDNQKPTIVLVQSTNHCIFGGYTTQSWSGNSIQGHFLCRLYL